MAPVDQRGQFADDGVSSDSTPAPTPAPVMKEIRVVLCGWMRVAAAGQGFVRVIGDVGTDAAASVSSLEIATTR